MFRLRSEDVPVSELPDGQKAMMWRLMNRYYLNVTEAKFLSDLAEKERVILLRDTTGGTLRGFSTVKLIETEVCGQKIRAVFSGDTIIDPAFWGEQELVRSFGRILLSVAEMPDGIKAFWFLISKGYKTYRYLPLYFRSFFPCHFQVTPFFEQETIHKLASLKFGDCYDPERGIVSFGAEAERLREGVADITEDKLKNPHIRYFVDKNPGHARGEELVCLAELGRTNFRPIFLRTVLGQKEMR